jgi:hypothetical protein
MSHQHPDSIQRWHRRPRSRKQGPKPRPCTNPRCPTTWGALDGHPYCLHCRAGIQDQADELRAKVMA